MIDVASKIVVGSVAAPIFGATWTVPLIDVLRENGLIIPLVSLSAVIAVVIIGLIVVGRLRGRVSDTEQGTHQLLTNFREMHAKGELSDREYRTIKTQLVAKLHATTKSASPDQHQDADAA